MLAGDTTRLRVTDMAKNNMLRVDDIWKYVRGFRGGITVKKEIVVVAQLYESHSSALKSTNHPFHSRFDVPQARRSTSAPELLP